MLKRLLLRRKVTSYIGRGELKIALVTIYVSIIGVVGLAGYVLFDANEKFEEDLAAYILCESTGTSSQDDCVLDTHLSDQVTVQLEIATVMIAFLPIILLIFLNKRWKLCCKNTSKDVSDQKTVASYVDQ